MFYTRHHYLSSEIAGFLQMVLLCRPPRCGQEVAVAAVGLRTGGRFRLLPGAGGCGNRLQVTVPLNRRLAQVTIRPNAAQICHANTDKRYMCQ
jgi:hypothetical protein